MLIKFMYKRKFGREMLYPINDAAKKVCSMTDRAVFKMSRIKDLLALGHEVEVLKEDCVEVYEPTIEENV
jgi:hypothetical protein